MATEKIQYSYSKTSVTLSATDTEVLSVVGEGSIDDIHLLFSKGGCEVILEIDSVEVYRLNTKDLKDKYKLKSDEDVSGLRLFVDGDKDFHHILNTPAYFKTSLKVIVNKGTAGGSASIKSHFISYRIS